MAKHLNYVRQNATKGKVRRIPDVAYNVYKSKYQLPTKEEGFKEVVKVDFYPMFDKHASQQMFNQWTES